MKIRHDFLLFFKPWFLHFTYNKTIVMNKESVAKL